MLTRKTPLRSNPDKIREWKKRTARPLPKIGKRGRASAKANKIGDAGLAELGIQSCELRLTGCWGNLGITRAHTRKRRNVTDLTRFCYACIVCHDIVEKWGEKRMEEFLEGIISKRKSLLSLED